MKLHLPKQLFTALLAAITLAAAPLSPAATTYTGTFAWAASDDESTDAVDESTLRLTLPADTPFSVALTSTVDQMATGTHNTSSYRPNTNVGTGGTWGLTFDLTTPEGGDSDIIGYSITGITLTAFTFNSSGGAQNNDERYFDLSLGGDLTGGISNKQITASNTGAFNLTTVDTGSELVDNEFTITATAGDSNPTTDGGSYLGLKEISLTAFAVISSTAEVTWTNSTGATWSGESWQTTTGTIGALANATAGTAKFTGDAAGSAYTVDVDTAASAGQLNVTSGDYTFAGTGSLSVTTGMNIAEDASAILEVDATLSGTIENAGSLKLGGTGTTTIDGIISGAGSLTVNKTGEGKVVLNAANTYTGNTTIESGVLSITDQAALGTGKTTVMSGAALAWGTTLTNNNGDKTQNTAFLTLEALNGDADITTKEGGYIQLTYTNTNDGREIRLGAAGEDLELKKNFQFMNSDGVAVHGGSNNSNRTLTITNATLKSDYAVDAVSQATIVVNGGALIAGSMNLGHTSTNGGHYGKLTMADGSIQTGTINFRSSKDADSETSNAIEITGGSLEFTNAKALNYKYGQVTDSTSSITIGGTGDKNVILKATKTAWTLDGAGRAQIQNITIDTDNQYAITLQNVNINGTITNNASLTNASLTLGAFTVATGTTATLGGTGITTASGIISGAGALKKTGTGTTTLSGANNYTGGTTIEGGTLKVTNASALGTGAVTVGNGTDEAILDVRGSQITNAVTLKKNATLQNTGNAIYAATNQISSLTLDGDATINAASRFGLVSHNGSSYNAGGTSLNLNGHTLTISGENGFVLVDTTISNGGKISISSGSKMLLGHTQYGTSVSATGTTVELNGGTLMLEHADTSMTLAGLSGASGTLDNLGTVNLTGAGTYSFGATVSQTTGTIDIQAGTHTYTGSSIDNTVKISAAGAKLILDSASSQTINGAISGAGTLQKDGAGTATVARVENMSGDLTVNKGTLNVTALSDMSGALTVNGGALNVTALSDMRGGLTVKGGTLTVNTLSDMSGDITVNGGALTVGTLSDMRGGLTVNEGSLTVTTLSGACDFEKNGTGTATLTTVDNITGGFTVSAGELSIGTFNVDTTLNLTVADDATLTLDTVVVNGQDNLNLAEGTTANRKYTTNTTTLAESANGNGYLIEKATYVLFNGYAWEGSVAGYTVKATTDKTLLESSGLSSHMKYYVNSGTENYAVDAGDSVIASDATKGIVLKEGTTLNMSTSLNTNATAIEVDGASDDENASNSVTINLKNDTVTLSKNQLSINSGTVTLTGSGVYDLGNSTTTNVSGLTDSENWTGTTVIKNATGVTDFDFNTYGNAKSKVQLIGVSGHFSAGSDRSLTFDSDVIFGNTTGAAVDGFTHTDGYSTTVYTFNGVISGTGNYVNNRSDGTIQSVFTGDVSGWTGTYKNTAGGNSILTFNDAARVINAKVENSGSGTVTVNIGGTQEGTVINGAITNSVGTLNITLDSGATATFNAGFSATSLNAADNATSSIVLGQGITATVTGHLDLSKGKDANATLSIGDNSTLTHNGNLWMSQYGEGTGSKILLGEKSKLSTGIVSVTGRSGSEIINLNHSSDNGDLYGAGKNQFQISNADVSVTADAAGSTMSNTLVNSSITNSGSGTLTVTDGDDLTAVTAANGNVAVNSSAVKINNVTVGAGENRKVSLQNDALVITATDSTKAATMTRNADTQGALARLQEDASFTIEDMTLVNTTITAATTTEVKLKNVTAENTMLARGNYTLSGLNATVGTGGDDAQAAPAGSNVSISYSTGLGVASDATLTLNLDVLGAVEQHGSGVYDITITLNGFGANYDFTQATLTSLVKFDSWLGTMLEKQGATYLSADEVEVAQVDAGTSTPTVSYTPSVGTLVITITGLNVPEPTTSTLSLLALAALAARRRRK